MYRGIIGRMLRAGFGEETVQEKILPDGYVEKYVNKKRPFHQFCLSLIRGTYDKTRNKEKTRKRSCSNV